MAKDPEPRFPDSLLFDRVSGDVTKRRNGERGAGGGNGERGTEVWERVVSGNLHKNPKWRSKAAKYRNCTDL